MRRTILLLLATLLLCALPLPAHAADLGSATGGFLLLTDGYEAQYTATFGPDGTVHTLEPPLPPSTRRLFATSLVLAYDTPPAHISGATCSINNFSLAQVEINRDGLLVFIAEEDFYANAPVRDGAFRFDCETRVMLGGQQEVATFPVIHGDPPAPPAADEIRGLLTGAVSPFNPDAEQPGGIVAYFDHTGTVTSIWSPLPADTQAIDVSSLVLAFPDGQTLSSPTAFRCNGAALEPSLSDNTFSGNAFFDTFLVPAGPDGLFTLDIEAALTVDGIPQDIHLTVTLP